MVNKRLWGMIMLLIILNSTLLYAIKVSPGSFTGMGLPVGEQVDLNINFTIHNDSETEQHYTIQLMKPSEVKEDWLRGYTDPPHAMWLYFRTGDTITVQPGEVKPIDTFFETPPGDEFYNQHWLFYVMVNQVGEEMFQASVAPAYLFETKSKATLERPPYGPMGMAPSIVGFEEVKPGDSTAVSFTLYNNDSLDHKYVLTHEVPEQVYGVLSIENREGYTWLPELSWISLSEDNLGLSSGSEKKIKVQLKVPEGSEMSGKKFESVIFATPDKGKAQFIRVRIDPAE